MFLVSKECTIIYSNWIIQNIQLYTVKIKMYGTLLNLKKYTGI